ncbi:MAG: DUF4157 domain-containing protein, partial [bacterium]|nr:DUF4157 domain-containing protein [bacterium]
MKRNRSKTTLREAKAKEPVKPKQEQKPAQTAFTLDGPVISADAPVLQTKTTCPCDGNCPHCKGTVQPKLKGGHNDRDQKETGPIINPLITPGQSGVTADESRKKTVRTKQLSGKTTTPTPGIQDQIQTLKGGGQPLPETTRNYFEPRFGKDLGNIRLHTGTKANDAAATLHAQAFTTGNNVAFGHGHYSPETIAGKKLLAHEITHTIQQQATQNKEETLRLRPQPGPFTVSDIYEKSDKEKDFVFFDWASPDYSDKPPESTLDSKEKQKIFNRKKEAELNQIPVNQIKLIGFASEEGNVNYNLKLIKRRLQAVENVLKNEAGYDKPVKTEEKLSSSKGKLDYRYWRAVEIRFNDETSTRDKQEKGAIVCPMEKQSIVETHRQKAFDMMNNPTKGAMPQLKRYIAKPDPNSTVAAKLDYLFGGDRSKETAIKVLNRINAIDIFLKEISYQTNILCGFPQTPNCKVGSIASTNPETGTIRLCPIFFSKKRKKLAPGTLMHEAAHASVYKTADMAYRNYRAMRILTTEQALDNADSLEEFVYHVYGIGTKVGPKKADKLSGCEKYKESINKTAAVAEHRNLYAVSGTAQTYDHPGNRAYMRPYFYKRFHRADKPAIAGIHDRYRRMYKLFKKQLFINCLKPDNKLCQSGSIVHWPNTRTVNICISPFMKKTPNNRIEHFHAGLARHMPGVTRKQSYAYPKLALDYWRHFWRNDGVQPRKAVDILHEDKYTTKDYKKTVDEWPKEKPIWPYLTQKSAKENYLRYIV